MTKTILHFNTSKATTLEIANKWQLLNKKEQMYNSKHTRPATTQLCKETFGVLATSHFTPFPATLSFLHTVPTQLKASTASRA